MSASVADRSRGVDSSVNSLPYPARVNTFETHEPDEPVDWPHGSVAESAAPAGSAANNRLRLADVSVTITDPDDDECILIRLGDHQHYLHSSTTREFSNMLLAHGDRAATITVHTVTHTLNQKALRALSQQLRWRLDEWNREARKHGFSGV